MVDSVKVTRLAVGAGAQRLGRLDELLERDPDAVSLLVGAVQADLANSISQRLASENAPLVRWPGSETDSVASPALLVTVAVLVAV